MHQYYNDRLPKAFNDFFSLVKHKHRYNTRLASKITYTLPLIRTNHELHSLRFYGPKLRNSVDEELKTLSVSSIKSKLQLRFISEYNYTEATQFIVALFSFPFLLLLALFSSWGLFHPFFPLLCILSCFVIFAYHINNN